MMAARRRGANLRGWLLAVLFIPVIAAGVNTANVVSHGLSCSKSASFCRAEAQFGFRKFRTGRDSTPYIGIYGTKPGQVGQFY
jgi:hypothetical protein